ncbi:MAG: PAS domain-containing protein [Hyphomicrobiales bacterium]|nr:PAS domain-containing protein [Hyphomicrobiales bacterium]
MAARLKFHETLFDSLPSPILLLDRQRRIIGENAAARKVFGRQQRDRDLAALLRNPDLLDAADQVLAGEPGGAVEFTLPSPANTEYRAMVEPLPRPGPGGAAAVLSLHDITALKRVEQMRADFIANASHELRTPLAALLGFIETLQGPARNDSVAREKFLGIMQQQATRMARLIDDLLSLSRIERTRHVPPTEAVDLALVARHVVDGLGPLAEQTGARLTIDAPAAVVVTGDRDELLRVAENLIENAVKYGGAGDGASPKPVRVRVSAVGARAFFAVNDEGPGIAAEHLPRLTERFYRVDAGDSRRKGGTGLGLAIVKHVLTRHRGRLYVDSRPGEGATFTAEIPLRGDDVLSIK